MLQGYHLITLTHRTAALEEIGRLVPDKDSFPGILQLVRQQLNWEELFFLATCNRVVFGFYTTAPMLDVDVKAQLVQILCPEVTPAQRAFLEQKLQFLHGGDAVRHLFEVASSMDSLVVGEREIVRQLREAFEQCRQWGLTGDHFRLLMRHAVEVSKQVFNETGIGEKALSVVALAYQKMRDSGITPQHHIVLVGAGATNALLVKFLKKDRFRRVSVYNRSIERASELAAVFENGQAYPLDQLRDLLPGSYEALVVCTGAVKPIITVDLFRQITLDSAGPLVIADLAVPNNVDNRVAGLFPGSFIEIEGLRSLAAENLTYRETARQRGVEIVSMRMNVFCADWHQRQVERSLHPMVEEIKTVKKKLVDTVFAQDLAAMDPESRQLVLEMLDYMERKCVAIPVKTMKKIYQSTEPFTAQKRTE